MRKANEASRRLRQLPIFPRTTQSYSTPSCSSLSAVAFIPDVRWRPIMVPRTDLRRFARSFVTAPWVCMTFQKPNLTRSQSCPASICHSNWVFFSARENLVLVPKRKRNVWFSIERNTDIRHSSPIFLAKMFIHTATKRVNSLKNWHRGCAPIREIQLSQEGK